MGLQHRKIIQHPLTVSPYAEMCNSSTKTDVTLNFEPYKYGGGKHVLWDLNVLSLYLLVKQNLSNMNSLKYEIRVRW